MRIRPPVAATLLLGLALGVPGACAPAFAGGEEEQDGDARHAHLLTEQQIRDSSLYTALDVVRTLRPAWIRVRPMSISNPRGAEVAVYVDGVRMVTGVDTLRQLLSNNISRMEFMTPADATTRFGTGHLGGAILVTTRRG